VLAELDPERNRLGFTLYGALPRDGTPAILMLRNPEDLHVRRARATLPLMAEARFDG
jgi:hypothetical protein